MSLHEKHYDRNKLRVEALLGTVAAPVLKIAYSYEPPTPLLSPAARAEREAQVARTARDVAARFGLDVITPEASATGTLRSREVHGFDLVSALNDKRVRPAQLEYGVRTLGRLHAFLAERWHSLGDASWSNVIVSDSGTGAPLQFTLCDFEHALWPLHAPFDDARSFEPPASLQAHWAPDDLHESLVTTACKLAPSSDVALLARAYAEGLSAESRTIALAVQRLFPLRRAVAFARVQATRFLNAQGARFMAQLAANYDVFAAALAEALDVPAPLRTLSPRSRALSGRLWSFLRRNEYGLDALGYHEYSRIFEDRDGAALRAMLATPALRNLRSLRVLEVGAGTGLVGGTFSLCEPTARITLLDASEPQLAMARAVYGARVDTVHGRMEQLPFAAGSFDRICLASVLRYSNDPAQVLAEVKRVLAPEGKVVVLPTDFSGANDVLYPSSSLRTAASIEAFFTSHGFRLEGESPRIHVRRGLLERVLAFAPC